MTITQTVISGMLASGALFAFLQFLITRHDSKKKEKKEEEQQKELEERLAPLRKALLALCSERLESLLHKWLKGDLDMTVARWAAIEKLYKAYIALGGNGEIRALYDIAKEVKPKE